MPTPAERDRAAIAAYRATQDLGELDVLRMDGGSRIAHALIMEWANRADPNAAKPYTTTIQEFLGE